MDNKRKTALVTGASSGIGRKTAIKLAENGFQVIGAARRMDRLVELSDQFKGIIPKKSRSFNSRGYRKILPGD